MQLQAAASWKGGQRRSTWIRVNVVRQLHHLMLRGLGKVLARAARKAGQWLHGFVDAEREVFHRSLAAMTMQYVTAAQLSVPL